MNIRSIWDNEGESFDRYTVVLDELHGNDDDIFSCLSMSSDPTHPAGFSQFCSCMEGKHLGKKLDLDELPENIRKHIEVRLAPEEEAIA